MLSVWGRRGPAVSILKETLGQKFQFLPFQKFVLRFLLHLCP